MKFKFIDTWLDYTYAGSNDDIVTMYQTIQMWNADLFDEE